MSQFMAAIWIHMSINPLIAADVDTHEHEPVHGCYLDTHEHKPVDDG
jgi:hypothetical protein